MHQSDGMRRMSFCYSERKQKGKLKLCNKMTTIPIPYSDNVFVRCNYVMQVKDLGKGEKAPSPRIATLGSFDIEKSSQRVAIKEAHMKSIDWRRNDREGSGSGE
ncbi:hypothetical protein PsorP6_016019 [Peronosclerospora sorghi]|uniref:Uncharacterized protein n=1 Tax=Peronosclerospora sorghi TaxID=230839 RepID=A0ACC0WRA6_9STRA|nr:hypothetical protein PsorP6_016019 [Peronosclerospora sorghi]